MASRVNLVERGVAALPKGRRGIWAMHGAPRLNGVVVAPDLQQLVVTDGRANAFVYDLRVPGSAPDQYALPNVSGTDALDYDPFNHNVYVINSNSPYYMSGIDLINKTRSEERRV